LFTKFPPIFPRTLAEYLAAFYVVEKYGQDKGKWRTFLKAAATSPIEEVKGFLLAMRDCCQS
jgi:hypothetical protein